MFAFFGSVILARKAIKTKQMRLLAFCAAFLLYDLAAYLFTYPRDFLPSAVIKWAEHGFFLLLIATVVCNSIRKTPSGRSVRYLPLVLSGAAVLLRLGRQVLARTFFVSLSAASVTDAQFDQVYQIIRIAALLMTGVRFLFLLILGYFLLIEFRRTKPVELVQEDTGNE